MELGLTLDQMFESERLRNGLIPALEKRATEAIEDMVRQFVVLADKYTALLEFSSAVQALEVALKISQAQLGNRSLRDLNIQLKLARVHWRNGESENGRRALSACIQLSNQPGIVDLTDGNEAYRLISDIAVLAETLCEAAVAVHFSQRAIAMLGTLNIAFPKRGAREREMQGILTRQMWHVTHAAPENQHKE